MIVEYRTPWSRYTGWCIAARGYARSMELADIRVHLTSWMQSEQQDVLRYRPPPIDIMAEVIKMLESPGRDPDVSVLSSTLGATSTIAFENWPKQPGASVIYTTFEREQVSKDIVRQMNRLDGVWVPCTWNAQTLVDCGVSADRVRVFPHVYFDDDPLLQLAPSPARNSFLWIGQWEPRKAPHNLIRAFLSEFHWNEGARLTLKTGGLWTLGDYPAPETVIEAEAARYGWKKDDALAAIQITRSVLKNADIVKLYNNANVYVSASRGEGFDLPCFQAALAGRTIVTTDSGGPRDFISGSDFLVKRTGSVPIHPAYNYGEGSKHIDYDVNELADKMRAAGESEPAPKTDLSRFRAEYVGKELSEWFASL
jgi:glycosyltransferase involved in cell wall biosynthesis